MGAHPEISSFHDTGVHADEGQHLQDVYPPARRFGGPGRFAMRPESHLTETSPLVSAESRRRLWSAWAVHWDLDKRVLLEKSPPNLVRTRFLQALFPESHFLVVVRHPLTVAYATKKWVRARSLRSLLRHWVVAHERCLDDARLVQHIAFVRYEDLVADPAAELDRIFQFIGLEPYEGKWPVKAGLNRAYLERWEGGALNPLKHLYQRHLEGSFEHSFRPWGYSLRTPGTLLPPAGRIAPQLLASNSERSPDAP